MSDQTILDPQAIENLRALSPDNGDEFLRELIGIYLQDTPGQVAAIDRALSANDSPSLVRAAHTIKGSSGNFGALRLAKIAQEIEAQGKTGDFAAASAACPQLKAEYALVTAALARLAGGT